MLPDQQADRPVRCSGCRDAIIVRSGGPVLTAERVHPGRPRQSPWSTFLFPFHRRGDAARALRTCLVLCGALGVCVAYHYAAGWPSDSWTIPAAALSAVWAMFAARYWQGIRSADWAEVWDDSDSESAAGLNSRPDRGPNGC
jgi:hypothetical protein